MHDSLNSLEIASSVPPQESEPSPKDSGTAEVLSITDKAARPSQDETRSQSRTSLEHSRPNGKIASPGRGKGRSGGFLLEPAPLKVPKKRRAKQSTGKQALHGADRRSSLAESSVRSQSSSASRPSWQLHDGSSERAKSPEYQRRPSYHSQHDHDHEPDHQHHHVHRQSPHHHDYRHHQQQTPRAAATIDPSDIVRMALSLSEGRRVSQGSPGRSPVTENGTRRNASAAMMGPAGILAADPFHGMSNHRELLRRPDSKHSNGRSSSPRSPNTQASLAASNDLVVPYRFSPGTLARAEKARNFIELHSEYRRALEHMPALIPARGSNRPNTRSNLQLGRSYNPLQYLRNKKVRLREQMILDPVLMGWDDTYSVKRWVDALEKKAEEPGFTDGDIAHVPHLPSSQVGRSVGMGPVLQPTADPFSNKAARPKIDWSVTPEGLIADMYWMEQDSHKAYIETRDGDKIYENFTRPLQDQWTHSGERKLIDRFDSVSSFGSTVSDDVTSPVHLSTTRTGTDESSAINNTNFKSIGKSKHGASKFRRTIFRLRANSNGSSDHNMSDGEAGHRIDISRTRSSTAENIGPLEKHMKQMQEAESSKPPPVAQSDLMTRPPLAERGSRRGGFSQEQDEAIDDFGDFVRQHQHEQDRRSAAPSSPSTADFESIPRISVDNYDEDARPAEFSHPNMTAWDQSEPPKRKSKVPRLGFLRRGNSKAENAIDENDFAVLANQRSTESKASSQHQDSPPMSWSSRSKNNSIVSLPKLLPVTSRSRPGSQDHSATPSKRLFKGGRLGQLLREESPQSTESMNSKARTSHRRSKTSLAGGDSSDEDEDGTASRMSLQRTRSFSMDDVPKDANGALHMKNLPTFRSANAPEVPKDIPSPVKEDEAEGHTSPEDVSPTRRRRKSRFHHLREATPDSSDVSPNTSTVDFRHTRKPRRRAATADATSADRDAESLDRSISGSRSRHGSQDRRLEGFLRAPGFSRRDGLPVTGLARLKVKSDDPHSWSVAATPEDVKPPPGYVTRKEVSYARCHILSTGIVARGILLRVETIANPKPDFLLHAAKLTKSELGPVVRRLMFMTAADLFSQNLEHTVSMFEDSATDFRQRTCIDLHRRIDDLRDQITPTLVPSVQACSDDTDAFIAELTTSKTMAVKQVNDAVDGMLRRRRRRVRLFRKGGFALLEWGVVGLLWFIWLFVCVFKAFRAVVVGGVRTVRWLLWL